MVLLLCYLYVFFFFNDTATTEIYTLSLHDALPIFQPDEAEAGAIGDALRGPEAPAAPLDREPRALHQGIAFLAREGRDRKSTRLNSSHSSISYAVFCLKKKKNKHYRTRTHTKSNNS